MELKPYKEKNFTYKILDVNEAQGIVEIAINAFGNTDSDGDISHPNSFNRTVKNNLNRIKHLAYHDRTLPIGLPREFKITPEYIIAVSQLNLQKSISKDIFTDYLFYNELGRTLEHSIGADMIENYFDKEKNANIVTEWRLLEYSTVAWGANENTPTLSVKGLERMLSFNYSEERIKFIEKILNLYSKYSDILSPELVLSSFESTLKNSTLIKESYELKLSELKNRIKNL